MLCKGVIAIAVALICSARAQTTTTALTTRTQSAIVVVPTRAPSSTAALPTTSVSTPATAATSTQSTAASVSTPTQLTTTTAPALAQSATAQSTATVVPTAVTSCHAHGATQYCMYGTAEYQVLNTPSATGELPAQYTGCHSHGTEIYCISPNGGEEVEIVLEGAEQEESTGEQAGENCHFHAGVQHCVGGATEEVSCERVDRDYNIPLRIGLLFVILLTSALGVFAPVLLAQSAVLQRTKLNSVLLVIKQFGTGIIISTAFIHLYTHAELQFASPCLGELQYEGTTAAILMAGLFVSFLVDYLSHRVVHWRRTVRDTSSSDETHRNSSGDTPTSTESKQPATAVSTAYHHTHNLSEQEATDKVTVMILEAGVLFHSILIGLILVVAGDSYFITLFIVIIFHQMFEGLALGSVLAAVPRAVMPLWQKLVGASVFALITPIGMAIGIGVLQEFNGNDRSTIIAIGTLDAFSAGILVWVGLVEMLAKDWMNGALTDAGVVKTVCSGVALVAGLVLMSVLGKWA